MTLGHFSKTPKRCFWGQVRKSMYIYNNFTLTHSSVENLKYKRWKKRIQIVVENLIKIDIGLYKINF